MSITIKAMVEVGVKILVLVVLADNLIKNESHCATDNVTLGRLNICHFCNFKFVGEILTN